MVDQYAKFLKQAGRVKWRKPIASLNYLLSSLGWRQEHNGYSHQNPSFVANVLEKHGEFSSVYFPTDGNSYTVTMEETFKQKNKINVIVMGKQKMPQWLSISEAKKQFENGIAIWDWVDKKGSKNPDVVFAASGDHMTQEVLAAVDLLKDEMPELKVRFVSISELTSLGLGTAKNPLNAKSKDFEKYFAKNVPIIYNFHGYAHSVQKLLFQHPHANRFSIHGYMEEGGTTTPFDMQIRNQTSRFHLIIDALEKVSVQRKDLATKSKAVIKKYTKRIEEHTKYIIKYGKDFDDVENWEWKNR